MGDLDLKIRHEREKENSHKDFQKQSIEYEKKLQDQIEEKNHILDEIKNELETQKKSNGTQKEFYVKEIKSLENKLDKMNAAISDKDSEIDSLMQKCEEIEKVLSERETDNSKLEKTISEQSSSLASLSEEVTSLKDNRKTLNDVL